jgi:8-amino-7-oxononanoate synthase
LALIIEGDEAFCRGKVTDNEEKACPQQFKRLLFFSGNDYLGLSSHPTIGNAVAKVCLMIFLFSKFTFARFIGFVIFIFIFKITPFSCTHCYNIMNFIVNQAAQEHGMGPRGSALICGYANYHRLLESSWADLKKKEVIVYNNC